MKSACFAVLLFFSALISRAEETAPKADAAPKTIAKKSESHKFSGLKLRGQIKKPEMSYIYQRKGLRHEKIIQIPDGFDDEIAASGREF